MGQYLQPTPLHLPVDRWVTPEEFAEHKRVGEAIGIPHVEAGPLVRSSYHAGEAVPASDAPRWPRVAPRDGSFEDVEEPACKPDPVRPPRGGPAAISLGARAPRRRSPAPCGLPGSSDGPPSRSLLGLAPGGACRAGTGRPAAGELLPHRFTLTARDGSRDGGLLSVALSARSPPPGSPQHPALRSPDFPRPIRRSPAAARPAPPFASIPPRRERQPGRTSVDSALSMRLRLASALFARHGRRGRVQPVAVGTDRPGGARSGDARRRDRRRRAHARSPRRSSARTRATPAPTRGRWPARGRRPPRAVGALAGDPGPRVPGNDLGRGRGRPDRAGCAVRGGERAGIGRAPARGRRAGHDHVLVPARRRRHDHALAVARRPDAAALRRSARHVERARLHARRHPAQPDVRDRREAGNDVEEAGSTSPSTRSCRSRTGSSSCSVSSDRAARSRPKDAVLLDADGNRVAAAREVTSSLRSMPAGIATSKGS